MSYYTYTQEQINSGQQKVNGSLCVVDAKIIDAIKALTDAIAAMPGAPRINLDNVVAALADAYHSTVAVADIRPPGCDPSLQVDSNHWSVIKAA